MAQSSPCKDCVEGTDIHLHVEIDHLKQHLAERDAHIEAMETEFLKETARVTELEEQIVTWREKYDRLYDSHKRVQKVNQNLEEKLLQMVDKCTTDKSQLTRDVETLSVRLAESNYSIGHLHKENERYKNDMNLAIQLLQCKPDNFVSQKFDSLPLETQARVSSYIMTKAKLNQEPAQSPASLISNKNISLSLEKVNPDEFEFNISASLMSKILEESVQNTVSKHCDTCTCLKKSNNPFSYGDSHYSVATQTLMRKDAVNSLCLNCNSDIDSSKLGLTARCSSPLPARMLIDLSDKEADGDNVEFTPLYLVRHPPMNNKKTMEEKLKNIDKVAKSIVKTNEDHVKLVSLKHKEIITKIGENLKEMNLKDEFKMPELEPITGHHRLCERTKQPTLSQTKQSLENVNSKLDEDKKVLEGEPSKSPGKSISGVNAIKIAIESELTFGIIENSVVIPNEAKNISVAQTKSDLNAVENPKAFRNSSISSNEAESKTSSSRSYKNNGSYSGSNTKVQIGPGPRFCSLRMQAGSKNILLDNAQPNIAPVLYTRQSRNLEASPLPGNPVSDNDSQTLPLHELVRDDSLKDIISNIDRNNIEVPVNINISAFHNVSNILDMPNEELVTKKPIELCEKPESGYKSNESAEIIDKHLFTIDDAILEGADKTERLKLDSGSEDNNTLNKIITSHLEPVVEKNSSAKVELNNINVMDDRKIPGHNVKVFNFDHYERSLKHSSKMKLQPERKIDVAHLNNLENTKIPTDSRMLFTDNSVEVLNPNYDLKIASKNLSEINKKFTRNSANQTLPENKIPDEPKPIDWKKEMSTEKSSSSLSSDDSAAVLQKQQLIRVAEWVQKNLEMEQVENDISDGCHRSVEELHHVRNDFPRPAKIEHRPRKNNSKVSHKMSYHAIKPSLITRDGNEGASGENTITQKSAENSESVDVNPENRLSRAVQDVSRAAGDLPVEQCDSASSEICDKDVQDVHNARRHHMRQQDLVADLKNSNSDYAETNASSTAKSYTREQLAKMEYNVKQFLLNGTRWTNGTPENYYSRGRRTSSKTETDL